MTRREQEALPNIFAFIAGAFLASALALVFGFAQNRDATDEQVVAQVIACSQAAAMCKEAGSK